VDTSKVVFIDLTVSLLVCLDSDNEKELRNNAISDRHPTGLQSK
jgi:hypothetical protein